MAGKAKAESVAHRYRVTWLRTGRVRRMLIWPPVGLWDAIALRMSQLAGKNRRQTTVLAWATGRSLPMSARAMLLVGVLLNRHIPAEYARSESSEGP